MLTDRQMRFKVEIEGSYTKLFNLYDSFNFINDNKNLDNYSKEVLIITLEDEIEYLEIAIDSLYKEMFKGE